MVADFLPNGPHLPLEFCRVSGDERLTLVIDETFGATCPTYAALSSFGDLNAALLNLWVREGSKVERRAASRRCPKAWAGRIHRRFFGSEKR